MTETNTHFTAKRIALMGILMALQIILSRFASINTPFVKIGFTFVAIVLMGMFFNPLVAGFCNMLADFIGITLLPVGGGFFWGFSISAFLTAALYSYFFYKKDMTITRIIIVNLIVGIILHMGLNTLWLYMLQGTSVYAFIPIRFSKEIILIVVQIVVTIAMSKSQYLKKQLIRFDS
ncbi:folate family ECF transporter S component [Vagococcus vulneris]|uniref:Folate family ECF transporter S component n=1 Tax=Vagococcus vulneris TaxID=1977869 RepID=A0A430A0M8_9ENTE|nr:folate family ECF transporter S component [Vagococcus vulneris]RST99872.1 hypothetical protein CBF37_03890 [Vagococcus vulneris]